MVYVYVYLMCVHTHTHTHTHITYIYTHTHILYVYIYTHTQTRIFFPAPLDKVGVARGDFTTPYLPLLQEDPFAKGCCRDPLQGYNFKNLVS